MNVARDYQGDDAVDTGFVDQVCDSNSGLLMFQIRRRLTILFSRRVLVAFQMISCKVMRF